MFSLIGRSVLKNSTQGVYGIQGIQGIAGRYFCEKTSTKKSGGGKKAGEGFKNSKSEEEEQLEAYHTVIDTAVEISRFDSNLFFLTKN
jgi:hypothetical protein